MATELRYVETWKPHPIYTQYLVSSDGFVRHCSNIRLRITRLDRDGYRRLNIRHDGKLRTVLVCQLVAETFIGTADGMTVNHKDGFKLNDGARNLEYISSQANMTHAFRTGLMEKCCSPITINGVRYYSRREAMRKTGVERRRLIPDKRRAA
jgi:hypothetical protein